MIRFILGWQNQGEMHARILLLICLVQAISAFTVLPGVRSKYEGRNPRIFQGTPAWRGEFPYQVHIIADRRVTFGGTLISDQWVITSASDVYQHSHWTLYFGITDLDDPESSAVIRASTLAIRHPDFDPAAVLYNDLALIWLWDPVPVNGIIDIATLPPSSEVSNNYLNAKARASGWGFTADDSAVNNQLLYTELSVISTSTCQSSFPSVTIRDTNLCATGDGSLCARDGGGPLVIYTEPRGYKLIGVASFISDVSCEQGFPSGYTRVTSFLPWIWSVSGIPPIS